jgi:hypothetical protein
VKKCACHFGKAHFYGFYETGVTQNVVTPAADLFICDGRFICVKCIKDL